MTVYGGWGSKLESVCVASRDRYFFAMTKLAQIQEAIRALPPTEQDVLRLWLDGAPLDLEQDSPELEAELLRGVRAPHSELRKEELESVAHRLSPRDGARRIA